MSQCEHIPIVNISLRQDYFWLHVCDQSKTKDMTIKVTQKMSAEDNTLRPEYRFMLSSEQTRKTFVKSDSEIYRVAMIALKEMNLTKKDPQEFYSSSLELVSKDSVDVIEIALGLLFSIDRHLDPYDHIKDGSNGVNDIIIENQNDRFIIQSISINNTSKTVDIALEIENKLFLFNIIGRKFSYALVNNDEECEWIGSGYSLGETWKKLLIDLPQKERLDKETT